MHGTFLYCSVNSFAHLSPEAFLHSLLGLYQNVYAHIGNTSALRDGPNIPNNGAAVLSCKSWRTDNICSLKPWATQAAGCPECRKRNCPIPHTEIRFSCYSSWVLYMNRWSSNIIPFALSNKISQDGSRCQLMATWNMCSSRSCWVEVVGNANREDTPRHTSKPFF